jgi:hypothetical protein
MPPVLASPRPSTQRRRRDGTEETETSIVPVRQGEEQRIVPLRVLCAGAIDAYLHVRARPLLSTRAKRPRRCFSASAGSGSLTAERGLIIRAERSRRGSASRSHHHGARCGAPSRRTGGVRPRIGVARPASSVATTQITLVTADTLRDACTTTAHPRAPAESAHCPGSSAPRAFTDSAARPVANCCLGESSGTSTVFMLLTPASVSGRVSRH